MTPTSTTETARFGYRVPREARACKAVEVPGEREHADQRRKQKRIACSSGVLIQPLCEMGRGVVSVQNSRVRWKPLPAICTCKWAGKECAWMWSAALSHGPHTSSTTLQ